MSHESAVGLLSQKPAANNDMRATKDDFLYLDPAACPADFAADLPQAEANFMSRALHGQARRQRNDRSADQLRGVYFQAE